jgi:hypothetical protein
VAAAARTQGEARTTQQVLDIAGVLTPALDEALDMVGEQAQSLMEAGATKMHMDAVGALIDIAA